MTRIQKEVIRNLLLAQIASDSGKQLHPHTNVPGSARAFDWAYKYKAQYIEQAVRLLDSAPPCGISYYCGEDEYHERVVYFSISGELLVSEVWQQISFHFPDLRKNSYLDVRFQKGSGRKTSWSGKRRTKNGGDSRKSCRILAESCGWTYIPELP